MQSQTEKGQTDNYLRTMSSNISIPYDEEKNHYEYDMAHLFAGPLAFRNDVIEKLRSENDELTPDILLEADFLSDPDDMASYESLKQILAFHKQRDRFCYIQTPGFF